VLIDVDKLAQLMIEHNLGVSTVYLNRQKCTRGEFFGPGEVHYGGIVYCLTDPSAISMPGFRVKFSDI
jgi:hypothetical protein